MDQERPMNDTCARDGHMFADSAVACPRCEVPYVEIARDASETFHRLDIEDRVRREIAQGRPVASDLGAFLLDRLDKRDGCHSREVTLAQNATRLVEAVEAELRLADSLAVSAALSGMRSVLVGTQRHGRRA